ncbi:hypothetical protein AB395_00003658 [Sinorhizobium fredii CCBAU 45436]|nr:hypothetical protein AB395_00003658 [Sinorhizobium fredii CCBAU 45436]
MTRTDRQSYHANVLNRRTATFLLHRSMHCMPYSAVKSVSFGRQKAGVRPPLDLR